MPKIRVHGAIRVTIEVTDTQSWPQDVSMAEVHRIAKRDLTARLQAALEKAGITYTRIGEAVPMALTFEETGE